MTDHNHCIKYSFVEHFSIAMHEMVSDLALGEETQNQNIITLSIDDQSNYSPLIIYAALTFSQLQHPVIKEKGDEVVRAFVFIKFVVRAVYTTYIAT